MTTDSQTPNTGAQLRTLGRIELADGTLENQHRLLVLIAYLAHEGQRDRTHVATVFWPNAKNPLNSLSSALTLIRRAAPDLVVVDRHLISVSCSVDSVDLIAALQAGRTSAAIDAFRGPFLDGFQLKNVGIELEEWIFRMRDSIAEPVAEAMIEASRTAYNNAESTCSADLAERALTTAAGSPLLLPHLSFLWHVLHTNGRPAATEVRQLANEFDIDVTMDQPAVPLPKVTSPKAKLYGREAELAESVDVVAPGVVLNIVGMSGIGKSALARAFSQRSEILERFTGGITTLQSATEGDGDVVVQNLLEHLDLPPTLTDWVATIDASLEEPVLVVLDDVRATPSIAAVLGQVRHIRNLCIVVLSNGRLIADGIEIIMLRGLATAAQGESISPAVQLFLECVGSHGREHDPALLKSQAQRLCERVAGIPLAIKLTAAWLRLLPAADVLAMIDDDDMLGKAPPGEDISLNEVIARSWEFLHSAHRSALTAISVLEDGFDHTAAKEVAGVGISEIGQLYDFAFLETNELGNIRCHRLVGTFARAELNRDPERLATLLRDHRTYFSDFLQSAIDAMTGPDQGATLDKLARNHDNIVAAWRAVVHAGDWRKLEQIIGPFDHYLLRSGRAVVAESLYAEALREVVRVKEAVAATAPTLHPLLANNLAWVNMLIGRPAKAIELCQQGLAALPTGAAKVHIALLRTECAVLGDSGAARQALAKYLEARELVATIDDQYTAALLDEDVGRTYALLGQWSEAIAAFRQTLTAGRAMGDAHMEARSYLLIGAAMTSSDPTHALVLFDEGEALAVEHGLRHLQAFFPKDRGFAFLQLGDLLGAVTSFTKAIAMAEEVGDHALRVDSILGLAQVELLRGDETTAVAHLQQGLRRAMRADAWLGVLGAGLAFAAHRLREDPSDELARRVQGFALGHTAVAPLDLERYASDHAYAPDQPLDPATSIDEYCELLLGLTKYRSKAGQGTS